MYFVGAVALAQLFLPRPPWSFLWAIRTDALCLGVLPAMFSQTPAYQLLRPAFIKRRVIAALLTSTLLLLLVMVPAGDEKIDVVPFSTGLVTIVAITLVFVASFDGDYIARGKWIKPLLMWIGTRSYAIYLTHFPAIAITRGIWWAVSAPGTQFGSNYGLRYVGLWLAITVIGAELNYRVIERPLRRNGRQIAQRLDHGAEQHAPAAGALHLDVHNNALTQDRSGITK